LKFGDWIINRIEVLFQPKREPNYSLDSILHFFANRLGISPTETLRMEEERRDKIFLLEKEIFDREVKENQIKNAK